VEFFLASLPRGVNIIFFKTRTRKTIFVFLRQRGRKFKMGEQVAKWIFGILGGLILFIILAWLLFHIIL
jgi:hypothetical protein